MYKLACIYALMFFVFFSYNCIVLFLFLFSLIYHITEYLKLKYYVILISKQLNNVAQDIYNIYIICIDL